jgi:hypothetical protein
MLEVLLTLASIAVLVLAGLWSLQRRLIYFPVSEVPPLSSGSCDSTSQVVAG